jgi:uncharacterized protein with LGFP repeats
MTGETGELFTDELFKKYIELGGGDKLGESKGPERITKDGKGLYRVFDQGTIYWTPETGAHVVRGRILAEWNNRGAELSKLGYPINDEKESGNTIYTSFQRDTITYNYRTGKCEVLGEKQLRDKYITITLCFFCFLVIFITYFAFHLNEVETVMLVLTAFINLILTTVRYYLIGQPFGDD